MPMRFAVALLACLLSADAFANSNGTSHTGRTWRDTQTDAGSCGGCHGARGTITVTLSGAASLSPGQAATYTVSIAGGTANDYMGLIVTTNESVATNPLSGSAPLVQAPTNALAHSSVPSAPGPSTLNRVAANGTASYSFTYTMPPGAAVGSTRTLHAVVRTGVSSGVEGRWNHANFSGGVAQGLVVTTAEAPPTAPSSLTSPSKTASSATLSWSGGGPTYRLVYKTGTTPPASPTDGTTVNLGAGTLSTTVSSLAGGPNYAFRIYGKSNDGTQFAAGPSLALVLPPAVSSSNATINGTVGSPVAAYSITATNAPTSYAGSALPPNVTVNPTTGAVSGSPTAKGTYVATLSASNAGGTGSIQKTYQIAGLVQTITFGAAPTPAFAQGGTFVVTASSNAGLPISFSTVSATCFLQSSTSTTGTFAMLGAGTCQVRADQPSGDSQYDPAAQQVQNVTIAAVAPNPPTIGSVQPGNGSATVNFSAPSFDGGSPITSYTATCGAFSATGAASPLVVSGLANGSTYSCTVTATNAAGPSAPSSAVGVTPTADPDGRLDPAFGTAGLSPAFFSGAGESARAIAVDSKQRIVVGGATNSGGLVYLAVARFMPTGALDPDFGTGGIFPIEAIGPTGAIEGLAIDEQGRILFAGSSGVSGNDATFTIGRLLPDGGLDESFAKGGYLKLPQVSATQGLARTIAPDAKRGVIHAAGWDKVSGQAFNAIVVRLDEAGVLDTNFGDKGILRVPLGATAGGLPEGAVTGLAIDSLGRAVVGGFADFGSNFDVFAMRMDEKGLDAAYGSAGVAIHDTGGTTDVAFSMRLDGKDRANLVGYTNAAGQLDVLLTRFDPDGGFQSDIVSDQGGLQTDFATALVITPDGKRLAGGVRNAGANGLDFAFARFLDGGGLDPGFGGSGRVSIANPGTDQLIAMQPHQPGTVVGLVQTGGQQRLARFAIEAPLPFAFTPPAVTSVGTTTLVQSNAVALQGLAGETYVTVQGGEWSRNCAPGAFTTGEGVVAPGDSVCVRHVTAALAGQTVVTTITVGGQSATFSSTPNAVVPPKTLTVTKAAGGTGTVASSPGGISCGATCSAGFPTNQPVTLFASPAAGSVFTGWSGACTGTGSCSVTMDVARSVTATFAVQQFTLTVSNPNAQRGTVTSNPGTIACGVLCSQDFNAGTVVTLTASPSPNFQFAGWTGAGCSGTGTCQVTMNANAAVSASFTAVPVTLYTLTVAKAGGGGGLVTSTPSGIDCGATCNADFNSGVVVALGAAPATDSFFAGWTGACTGTGACNVTMDAAKSVTATFKPNSTIPRLANISTRMQVLTGNDVLIGGFIIGGNAPKTVVVRARGPSLIPLGVPNAIPNPRLDLFSGQTVIASSTDWGTNANAATIQASGFAPSSALEAAIHITLTPGAYTAIVSGEGGVTGVGIIEVFEVDHPEVPLANISTRGQVLTGGDVMIGGFIIQGDAPQTVVVRARGPSLAAFGIANFLGDPVLQLFSGPNVIASNDDWQLSPDAANIQARGFAPSDAKEAVILVTLPPGAYTAIVSGKNGGTGVGIIEVFAQ